MLYLKFTFLIRATVIEISSHIEQSADSQTTQAGSFSKWLFWDRIFTLISQINTLSGKLHLMEKIWKKTFGIFGRIFTPFVGAGPLITEDWARAPPARHSLIQKTKNKPRQERGKAVSESDNCISTQVSTLTISTVFSVSIIGSKAPSKLKLETSLTEK